MKKKINVLSILITILSFIAALVGVASTGGPGKSIFPSIHNQDVEIYGRGIYKYDSVEVARQAIAQDYVTLLIAIPILIIALWLFNKGLMKGKILLTGTIAYFLYTYMSYSFLANYNPLFLVYVILFSLSLFTLIILMTSFNIKEMASYFKETLPIKFISYFCFFISFMLMMMWLGRIGPPLLDGTYPETLQHYTTLTIQVLDLGLIVPLGFISGYLLLKRNALGYLLAPIFMVKGITLGTAVTAMAIYLTISGVEVSMIEMVVFPLFNILVIISFVFIFKNIKER